MRSLLLPLPLFTVALLPAQTFVVDANGGPGSAFTSIATAVASVPDGAKLVVRAGTYSPFDILGKGLTILGEPGAVIASSSLGFVNIFGQNQDQVVVLRALAFGSVSLSLHTCQAAVQIEDCVPSPVNGSLDLSVIACPQVHVSRSSFVSTSGCTLAGSGVVCVDTTFISSLLPHALQIYDGLTQLIRCRIQGGPGVLAGNNSAMALANASVRMLGGSVSSAQLWIPVMVGTGTVRLNAVAFRTGPAVGITVVYVDDACTSASAANLGGTATGMLEGRSQHTGALLVGLPAPATVVPGCAEELWLALPTVQLVAVGTVNTLTPVTSTIAVPAIAELHGTTFGWQGITLDPARGFVLSNPAWFTVM